MITADYAFSQAVLPTGSATTVDLLIRFRADVATKPRRRLNLALVIDRSGSMAGPALRYALQAAEAVVDALEPDDLISVVVYDDEVDTIVDPQLATNKDEIKQAIRRVRAGGLTNLAGGWLEGCKHVQARYDAHRLNRVMLLTDGHANVGISDPRVLIKTAGQKAEEGIVTTTLGFGNAFNEDLLIGMARAAAGNFYYIQSIDEAAEVFGIELDSLKSVVAQNLTATLTLTPDVAIADVLSLAKQETKGTQTILVLGDVYEGEDKLLGLAVQLPEYASGGPQPVLDLTFTADAVEDEAITTVAGSLSVQAQAGTLEEAASAPATGVMLEVARLRVARAKERALDLTDANRHAEAEQTLRDVIAELRARGLHEHFEIAEEIEQLEYFADRIARKNLDTEGRKELRDQSFQGLARNRGDLVARGVAMTDEVRALPVASEVDGGVELVCVREGGKLRVKVVSDGFDPNRNVQFPRAIRAEGARYVVETLEPSADGSFYRTQGLIARLVRPGEVDTFAAAPRRSTTPRTGKAATGPASAADLETTDTVGDGVLVQCIKEGSKLRARVVADGFEPDWNMRFPRSVREEGMLYVVDEVIVAPDGKSYIACGKVRRFVQT